MPSRSSASESSPAERRSVANYLYRERGAEDARLRCRLNSQLGERNLVEDLIHHMELRAGHTVFDVCCGTGEHLVRYHERVGPNGQAMGFDFSPEAIAEACRRGVSAVVAEGDALPARSGSAHALSCAYGVYYLPDVSRALREWRRVLRPGGRLVISGPAPGTNAELYEFHRRATGQGPSDADLMAIGFIDGELLTGMEHAGFEDIQLFHLTNPITFPDANSFLDYWVSTSVFARTRGAKLEDGIAALAGHGGPLVITKRISIAVATR